jgi:hypothetical protein
VAAGMMPCRVGGWEIRGIVGGAYPAKGWGWAVVHPTRRLWGPNGGDDEDDDSDVAVVGCGGYHNCDVGRWDYEVGGCAHPGAW